MPVAVRSRQGNWWPKYSSLCIHFILTIKWRDLGIFLGLMVIVVMVGVMMPRQCKHQHAQFLPIDGAQFVPLAHCIFQQYAVSCLKSSRFTAIAADGQFERLEHDEELRVLSMSAARGLRRIAATDYQRR